MSVKPETVFTYRVRRTLEAVFGKDMWLEKIQQLGIRGTPDFLACVKGHFVALELKTDSGKLAPLQDLKLKKIAKAGGFARVVTPTNFQYVLRELKIWTGVAEDGSGPEAA